MERVFIKRIDYIDKLRGIAMLLVLIGHNDTIITSYIYSFHMPLFFFISGLLHNNEDNDFSKMVKKKFKSLIIPYFILAIILYIIWVPLIQFQGINISKMDMVRNFIGIFYSQGATTYMWWGMQLWFLPCLFITSVIFYFLGRLNKKLILICMIFISIIGFLLGKFLQFNFLWSFDIALVGVLFYGSGFLLKNQLNNYKLKVRHIIYLCIIFIFFIIFNRLNGRVDMYSGNYNNILLFIVNSFLGIYISIVISKAIKHGKIIKFIGTNTIIILAFHIRALDLIKSIYFMNFKLLLNTSNILNGVILVPILEVIIIIPIILLLKQLKGRMKHKNIKRNKEREFVLANKY